MRLRFFISSSSQAASRLAAPALLALSLTGCAHLFGKDDKESEQAGAPAKAPPVLRLQVEAPRELKQLLEANLDLGRLPTLTAGKPLPQREVDRLVAAAPQQAKALLETEGYFASDVKVAQTAPAAGGEPVVKVTVNPGQRTHVGAFKLDVQGPLQQASDSGDVAAVKAQRNFREGWPLPPGAVFRNPQWSDAKRAAISRLRGQGYARADWVTTLARVDAQLFTVDLALLADSGPLFRSGPLQVQGLLVQDLQTVENLANFAPGTPVTEKLLLDYQERLQKSGLFSTASVQLDATAPDPAAAPVNVRLAEQQLQNATVGIGVSSDVGVRGTLEHTHRRPFGWAATARNKFELGGLRQAWEGELSTHTLPGLHRNLVSGGISREKSDTDIVSSANIRLGRAEETARVDRLTYVEFERSLQQVTLGTPVTNTSNALGLYQELIFRDVDSTLLPTTGSVAQLQYGAGQARSDPGGSGPFGRLYVRLNHYKPVGGGWFSQFRVELGQVASRGDVTVPDRLRFRAGGDTSVRGYEYRSLTPLVNGVETGGKVLFTGSAEIAHPIVASIPQLWGALFIDAGRAADRWSGLHPALGYGAGVRYRSPIGPLSLDLAYGEEVKKFRLHLSVGMTF